MDIYRRFGGKFSIHIHDSRVNDPCKAPQSFTVLLPTDLLDVSPSAPFPRRIYFSDLQTEAAIAEEISVNIYQIISCRIPGKSSLHIELQFHKLEGRGFEPR
jgi:hypothetical protein